jgi:S1/P1 Nuclease
MKAFFAALLLIASLGGPARAWGPEGHVVIAMVAEDRLTPQTRKAVRKILSGAPLATAALFADEYRVTHPETTRWHFVDIPFEASGYDEARDCQVLTNGDCIIHAIERAKAVIKDPKAKPFDRSDALKYLVHFVGDLHQPFHAIERKQADGSGDEGGNKVDVKFFDNRTNLHALWDSGLILDTERTAEDYAALLKQQLAGMNETQWRTGTTVDWAHESHAAAKQAYVDDNAVLGQAYFDAQIVVVDKRLALAGARLAWVLEEILK